MSRDPPGYWRRLRWSDSAGYWLNRDAGMPPDIPHYFLFSQFGARGFASGAAVLCQRSPNARSGATGPIIPPGFGSGFSQFGRECLSQSISGGDVEGSTSRTASRTAGRGLPRGRWRAGSTNRTFGIRRGTPGGPRGTPGYLEVPWGTARHPGVPPGPQVTFCVVGNGGTEPRLAVDFPMPSGGACHTLPGSVPCPPGGAPSPRAGPPAGERLRGACRARQGGGATLGGRRCGARVAPPRRQGQAALGPSLRKEFQTVPEGLRVRKWSPIPACEI
jgi:hypothetical protein